ncbi:MAG: hypothetical protein GF375_04465, partial [Candidatus Omnitrophica bacterium]|nr:hypothetical protein [Candidatus Omnitrophota bacterium]MBD3269283.1 hypothetical protein [Candidatus Omnitrophota bacterium]
MKRESIGLYIGVSSVGVAKAQGKNIINLAKFDFTSSEPGRTGAINEDIRWEALINRALREVGAETKDVYVSIADRDFIFRPLELPIMKKNEIEASLSYEVEKYIPFKMDELAWDYEYVKSGKEKKIKLSFIGIRDNNLKKIKDILSRLELKPLAIEPSCLSLARTVKSLKSLSKLKNFALLDFTQSESYLTFFQNELPVFNRYFTVSKKGESYDVNKFIESVNFSFQYFSREFKYYNLEKFIVVGDHDTAELISLLRENIQVDIEHISSYDLTSRQNGEVESVKALGVAQRDVLPFKFKTTLRQEGVEAPVVTEGPLPATPFRFGLFIIIIVIGLIVSVLMGLYFGNEISVEKFRLSKREKEIEVPKGLLQHSWERREQLTNEREGQIANLRDLQNSFIKFSPFFQKLGQKSMLPQRLWLDSFTLRRRGQSGKDYQAKIKGYIYRDDDYEERLGLDEFIFNLKQEAAVNSIFKNVELESSDKQDW